MRHEPMAGEPALAVFIPNVVRIPVIVNAQSSRS
jgi:hypothetical protein